MTRMTGWRHPGSRPAGHGVRQGARRTFVAALALAATLSPAAPAAAQPVDQATFVREFQAAAQRFDEPTSRLALQSSVRLSWASPDIGDPLVIRIRTLENPDGSLEVSLDGAPTGDVYGMCTSTGTCHVTTDGGATWLTGPRPKGDLPWVDSEVAGYDPLEWGRRDFPAGAAYDITGSRYTVVVDADTAITTEFSRRTVTVTGILRDDDARVRIDSVRQLVAPRSIRVPS